MTLPPPHDIERLRRRLVYLIEAEAYLDVLEDELMADGLEYQLTDRPNPPAYYTVDHDVRVAIPPNPDLDLAQMLEVFDYALERSPKCPSP